MTVIKGPQIDVHDRDMNAMFVVYCWPLAQVYVHIEHKILMLRNARKYNNKK